jgi:competence protein ComEC
LKCPGGPVASVQEVNAEVSDAPRQFNLTGPILQGARRVTIAGTWAGIKRWIAEEWERQAPNAVLWWPVLVGVGVALFFALPTDPLPALSVLFLCGSIIACIALAETRARGLCFTVAMIALGFAAADLRTFLVRAPILSAEIGPVTIRGTVAEIEPSGSGYRITLEDLNLGRAAESTPPHRVRIRIPGSHGVPDMGMRIYVRSVLRPPGRPVLPGGFDFQRYSFYRQLGGVGFSVGRWTRAEASTETADAFDKRVRELRFTVGQRLSMQMPKESGAVARALVTGERAAVPEPLQQAYRQSGLAHMLAISGLHMSLLAGLAFVSVRRVLALILPVAERFNTKKIAAVAALGAALFYLLLSGMNIPAQRAFIMVAVVFAAVMIDRSALSLRTLAWAAMAVLLLQPDALLGASFQLSFAAVLLLITVYERVQIRPRLRDEFGTLRPVKAVFIYAVAVLITDLIATGATAPFTGFHFHEIPKYSLVANLLAVPVMGLWIMPWGLLALVLMPFGLDGAALAPMGAGIELVNAIAKFVSGLPGATVFVPQAPAWALVLVTAGGLMLCLWRGALRWSGAIVIAIAIPQPWLAGPPDLLIDENAEVFAVKGTDGRLVFSPGRSESFTRDVWREGWGTSRDTWAKADNITCGRAGCIYANQDRSAALALTEEAVIEDCGRVDVMIAIMPVWKLCGDGVRIDRFDVWRNGAHAIWLNRDGIAVQTVARSTGRRVWNEPTWRQRR